MNLYDKISSMNSINSIWWYTKRLRLTYVSKGWLVVWDHQENPPARYDCQDVDHVMACNAAVQKLQDLTAA